MLSMEKPYHKGTITALVFNNKLRFSPPIIALDNSRKKRVDLTLQYKFLKKRGLSISVQTV